MGINPAIAAMHGEITAWRRDLHRHPELLYDVHRTAEFVARQLTAFGCDEVATGIGRTGVVGLICGKGAGRTIGLRADMDALPITEASGVAHASTIAGRMHACGHDGHTAMLLGAARILSQTRNFTGAVAVIFQPAEEGGAGGRAMVEDGLMERFSISEVYGMHNLPGLEVGRFAMRSGPIMASTDMFSIAVEGKGGHAAMPHGCIDAPLAAAQVITALQSVVSRTVDPVDSAVVSVTSMRTSSEAFNVLPQSVDLKGTIRALRDETRSALRGRVERIVTNVAQAFGATARFTFMPGYPVTVNHAAETAHAIEAARDIAGEGHVDPDCAPMMGAEDFSYMLNARPGCFIFTGNGESAGLHNPAYDFNDDAALHGASYWVRLVERRLPLAA